jgi:PPOX class probable FMN-dependent enzyme
MTDQYAITSHEQLRTIIPEAKKRTQTKIVTRLGKIERTFIERAPMVFISSADRNGKVTVSPKGDAPGFVSIADDHTLLIPERPGNGLAYGLSNMLDNPHIGLVFVIPGSTETFRVDGRAELTRDPELLRAFAARNKDALLVVRVRIERCFFHCSKAFIRSQLWQADTWPEPFKLSWGEWAKQWYDVPAEAAGKIDAEIVRDERENL